MGKYENAVIYKICCKDTKINDFYIGSTCGFLYRKRNHKSDCSNENRKNYNIYLYKFIRDNGGWDNWDMIQIKKVKCDSKRELELYERKEIELLKPTLNINLPCRTKGEYDKIFRDKYPNYYKEYYQKIKEKMYEPILCECGKYTSKHHYNRHCKSKHHLSHVFTCHT